MKRACKAVGPKNEVRLNAGSKPGSADRAGGSASLPGSSDDIYLLVLSLRVKPACLTELPLCCNSKCQIRKKRQIIKNEKKKREKGEEKIRKRE